MPMICTRTVRAHEGRCDSPFGAVCSVLLHHTASVKVQSLFGAHKTTQQCVTGYEKTKSLWVRNVLWSRRNQNGGGLKQGTNVYCGNTHTL